jgi:hypothetical protein
MADYKKDKTGMDKKNNAKITAREFEEAEFYDQRYKKQLNVDRIMLERQMTTHNFENDKDQYVGEVTGEHFDNNDVYDKGMPIRSSYVVRKSKFDNNQHLDFDLFDKIDKTNPNTNVIYNDTTSGEYAELNDAMKNITSGSDPYEQCITDINHTTCWMHSNMYMISSNDYIVSGFGLFSAFGAIYLVSRGNTELELKNYFNYQDKKHLNAGLLTTKDLISSSRGQIVVDNYIVNDRNVPTDQTTADRMKRLIVNIITNKQYSQKEADRVNNVINRYSGMLDVVSPNTLQRSVISIISVAKLQPIWNYRVDGVVSARFHNNMNGMMQFIKFVGKTFDYYEDSIRQIVEIPMLGDIFSIGFILGKQDEKKPIDLQAITIALNYMKPTVLDSVMIPAIKKRYRTRFNKTLQKTGLQVTFTEQEINGLYPEGGNVDDCLQYVDLMIGTKSANKKSNNTGYRTTRKFIANRTFEFYLRNTANNCLLMIGRY